MTIKEYADILRMAIKMQIGYEKEELENNPNANEDFRYGKPEDKVMTEAMQNDINIVLNSLRQNEADVIKMRFGLNGIKPMSLKEVGSICNLTKERIRQIEKHAISRMQHPSRSKRLESYVA